MGAGNMGDRGGGKGQTIKTSFLKQFEDVRIVFDPNFPWVFYKLDNSQSVSITVQPIEYEEKND